MESEEGTPPEKGDQYRRPDGSLEVVFAVEDGRVLTFREYPDVDTFARETADTRYAGRNREVETLPDVESFRDLEP